MSSGGVLKFDPNVLKGSGTAYEQVASALANLHPEMALSEAAAGVSQLKTGAACASAETTISTEMTTLVESTRKYGQDLTTAATQYLSVDKARAAAIASVQLPK